MNRILFCFFFGMSLVFLYACSGPSATSLKENHFDSDRYFSREAARLTLENKSVYKRIRRNTETDSGSGTIGDWKRELEPFLQCNISKPSMSNSYTVDSVSDATTRCITYSAMENQLTVRSFEVTYSDERIMHIRIATRDSNRIYQTTRSLTYVPDSGYSITGTQRMRLGENTEYLISATWN